MLIDVTKDLRVQIEHIECVQEITKMDLGKALVFYFSSGFSVTVDGWDMAMWDSHLNKILLHMQLRHK